MIISIDAEKVSDKTQYLFMTLKTQKNRIEQNFLNLVTSIYKKSIANIILNDERWNISLYDGDKARISDFPTYS